ncbi:MAG: hypothetical protein IPL06_19960 [Betaproteobacteria bacterium]|nr:hypothetical protein [Betaproteobacteria bacterium]
MQVLSRCLAVMVFVSGILAALVAGVAPAGAQCGMNMGGGGHDHSTMQGSHAAKPSGSEKKLAQSIDRVLSDEHGRAMLADALLNDRAFMEALVQRLAAIPEWRAMAARQLAGPAPAMTDGNSTPAAPSAPTATYVCPMHADVTSSTPGDCPKCGMALVRKDTRRE